MKNNDDDYIKLLEEHIKNINECRHDIGYLVSAETPVIVCMNCETLQDPKDYEILRNKYLTNTKVYDEQDIMINKTYNIVKKKKEDV